MHNNSWLTICLVTLLALAAVGTLISGAIPWEIVWQEALGRVWGEHTRWNPLLDERLPRLLVLLTSGASLAVSGAVMQALFRNPLAAPSVLGIHAGGSLLVVFVFLLGLHYSCPYLIAVAAFVGCLATLSLVYLLARKQEPQLISRLILTGIALATLLLAIQGAVTYAFRHHWHFIQLVTEWESGSSADRSWSHVHMQLPLALIGLGICWHYRREIDLMTLGEEEALNLGVEVGTVRWRLFFGIALLTAGSLAALGNIAFFGLLLPHLLRSLAGPSHRALVPLCILGGAATLAAIDLLLRLLGWHTLSIGTLSALIGGLFFLMLLFRLRPAFAQEA